MSGLDHKLQRIAWVLVRETGVPVDIIEPKAVDVFVAQIKQAFQDNGWYRFHPDEAGRPITFEGESLMAGQEWYDKFRYELGLSAATRTEAVLKAAKRAAGLTPNSADGSGVGF